MNVKGPKGELEQVISDHVSVNIDGNVLTLTRSSDDKDHAHVTGYTVH